jgi:hypothetical protein
MAGENLDVKAGYDPRFGTVGFLVNGRFCLPLKSFLEQLKIDPNDFKALFEDKYQWTEPMDQDIDPARVRLLEEQDWKGKVVLDIGGYDGFAAEIAHKGGASQAICLDNHQYEHYGWEDKKKKGVEYIQGDVFDWKEPVDITILYNVAYHVKDIWGLFEKVRSITKEKMLLCTLFRYHSGSWVYLYEPRECNPTDESVIWGPSLDALERLLRFTGWDAVRYALSHDRVLYDCEPDGEPQSRQSKY